MPCLEGEGRSCVSYSYLDLFVLKSDHRCDHISGQGGNVVYSGIKGDMVMSDVCM